MHRLYQVFCIVVIAFLVTACQDDEEAVIVPIVPQTEFEILHIAHTRMANNVVFNPDINRVDFSQYDLRLLGGDLAYTTTTDYETIDSLDRIFDFSSPATLWALGNHDYDDLDLVTEFTKRPAYYTHHQNEITYLVLDTQDSLSSFVGEQLEMINNVADTISESEVLIVLTHKLIWLLDDGELEANIDSIPNGVPGACFYCLNPNNFYDAVYPRLKEVKEKGIEVICLAGDLGRYTPTFEHETADGIHFLASGMELDEPGNTVLLFNYNSEKDELDWEFKLIEDLE